MGNEAKTRSRGRRMRTLAGAVATAAVAVTMLAMPATASAAPTVQKPTMTTTLDGSNLTINLQDPHAGLDHLLTVCTTALLNAEKAIPLLPGVVSGQLPPLDQIDPALFQWGPSLDVTNALARGKTYHVNGLPAGIYVALGVCINPTNLGKPAFDYKPVLVGSPIALGSSALGLGSTVLGTPGAPNAVLTLLGIDAGSLSGS